MNQKGWKKSVNARKYPEANNRKKMHGIMTILTAISANSKDICPGGKWTCGYKIWFAA